MKNNLKIVFLDRGTAGPIELKERFSKYGEYLEYTDTAGNELEERIKDVQVIVLNRIKMGEKEFLMAPELKLILITATGYNHIDLKAAKERGIKVANVSGYSTNSVAQLTITLLLNELTKINDLNKKVRENKWNEMTYLDMESYPINDVEGKVLGILGYGNIGKKVEQMAKALGMKTIISKIPGRNYADNESEKISNRFSLDEVMEKCDILTIHAPLTDLTRDVINLERMKKMKKSAIILNLGRGPIINEKDLYIALKEKIIKSAAVDVLAEEPPKENSKLFKLKNLTITPHIAWKSEKSLERLFEAVENNLKMYLDGKLEGLN